MLKDPLLEETPEKRPSEEAHPPNNTIQTPPDASVSQLAKLLAISTIPLILTNMTRYLNETFALHFLKSLGELEVLDAYALAASLISLVCMAIFSSLGTGLTSRASQAFGAENYQLVGLYLHKSLIINLIIFIPVAACFYFSDQICLVMGYDALIAQYIQQMLSLSIPGMFALMIFLTITAYLNGCNHFAVPGMVEVASCFLDWTCNYIFIGRMRLGIKGAAISTNISSFSSLIVLVIYLAKWNPAPNTLFWPYKESFLKVWEHFVYQVWLGSMAYLEWIAYEVILIFSGRLDSIQLTSTAIAYANSGLVYGIPYGFINTVLAFTGNALGEKNIIKAKNSIKAGVLCSVVSMVLVEVYYVFFSELVARFYVDDEQTVQETTRYFHAYLLQIPPEFIQLILSSGLRAIGKEKIGTLLMLLGFYFIAIPASYLLCFTFKLGGIGLIFGPALNQYLLLIAILIVYCKIDWNAQLSIVLKGLSV